jgi:hypothetical protein
MIISAKTAAPPTINDQRGSLTFTFSVSQEAEEDCSASEYGSCSVIMISLGKATLEK